MVCLHVVATELTRRREQTLAEQIVSSDRRSRLIADWAAMAPPCLDVEKRPAGLRSCTRRISLAY